MLALDRLVKTYRGPSGRVAALSDVSLEVAAGEFVAVRGPSGCGKSTLLLAAGGLLAPDAGTVRVEGTDLYALGPNARAAFRARSIGFVFQQFHLVPYLSVRDNVLSAALATHSARTRTSGANGSVGERADLLVERFGLSHRAHHVPAELSTGEKQRAALARALLHGPKLLLADEPTGNLDAENSAIVLRHLEDFAAGGGAVLLVTHDPAAERHAHRSVEIRDGHLAASPT